MKTFRNKKYTRRNYDCTNIVACQAETLPGNDWEECAETILEGLTSLYVVAGVRYFGYL